MTDQVVQKPTADDPPCTDCGGSGWNGNTERVCSCQPPAPAAETAPFADTDRLTCRDPDLDMDALERAHGRVLTMYRSCMVGGAASVAAEWEALLVASGYGWPARPAVRT